MNPIVLQAAAGAAKPGFDWTMILMLVAMFAILYFFMIRPQQKKQKEIKQFRDSLAVGSHVVTASGVYGTIKNLCDGEAYVILEIAKGVEIKVDRNYIFADSAQAVQK